MASHQRSRRTIRKSHARMARAFVEVLEGRQLMTTIAAGSNFTFQDQAGNIQRVELTGGGGTADLIGSTVNSAIRNSAEDLSDGVRDAQVATLNDIPGRIVDAGGTQRDVLGGIGGRDGVEPLQVITGAANSFTNIPNLPVPDAPNSAGINIAGIASNSTGKTYALQVRTIPGSNPAQKSVDLLSLNYTGNGQALAVGNLAVDMAIAVGAGSTADIQSIRGMEFRPGVDNIIYFIAVVNVGKIQPGSPQPVSTPVPFLFSFNLNTQVTQQVGEFISDDVNPDLAGSVPNVTGLAFAPNGDILTFGTARRVVDQGTGVQRTVAETGLIRLRMVNNPPTAGDFGEYQLLFNFQQNSGTDDLTPILRTAAGDLNDLHALVTFPGDSLYVYGITGANTAPQLVRVRIADGRGVIFGPLTDPDPGPSGITRGQGINDFTFNKKLANPFIDAQGNVIGKRGVLLAADVNTDELVVVDTRNRYPSSFLFSTYLTNTTNRSRLIVSQVNGEGVNAAALPFGSSDVTLNVTNAQTGAALDVDIPAGIGTAFIGAINNAGTPVRRIRKASGLAFGSAAAGKSYIIAGINVSGSVDRIQVGGVITGNIIVSGSVNRIYAGALLVGDAAGRNARGDNSDLYGSFNIGGNLGELVVQNSVGAIDYLLPTSTNNQPVDPAGILYFTGFDAVIGGQVGKVITNNSFVGSLLVYGRGINSAAQNELEVKGGNANAQFLNGDLNLANFTNDTYATSEEIATQYSDRLGTGGVAIINGGVASGRGDDTDYYSIALLAGQTVSVQLLAEAGSTLNVGVFDADQRLIATDFNSANATTVRGESFRFTADRPGKYAFAVGYSGDRNFTGAAAGPATNYTLQLQGLNSISLGELKAANNILHIGRSGIDLRKGDLGSETAGGQIINANGISYNLAKGNLRLIEATSLGSFAFGGGVDILTSNGSVGLIRTTGDAIINANLDAIDDADFPIATNAVGFDIQTVDVGGTLFGNLMANRGIGIIRAGDLSTTIPSNFVANADQQNDDGIIDLLQVNGQVGTRQAGGPSIRVGPGGNLRYFVVPTGNNGDDGILFPVYRSAKFGGGQSEATVTSPGQNLETVDDSGTPVTISPGPFIDNLANDPNDPLDDNLNPATIAVTSYAVDDATGAGGAIICIFKRGSVGNEGITVTTGSNGGTGGAEIGSIVLANDGRTITEARVTTDEDGLPITGTGAGEVALTIPGDPDPDNFNAPTADTPVSIVLTGSERVDLWNFNSSRVTIPGDFSTIDFINNQTGGDVVNGHAASIGNIVANNIGVSYGHASADRTRTALVLMGNAIDFASEFTGNTAGNTFFGTPFDETTVRGGIILTHVGNGTSSYLVSARARQSIGNIYVQGIINEVVANSDGKNTRGIFEGIVAPIFAAPTTSASNVTDGRINSVDIGEGLPSSGAGSTPISGIFAGDRIGTVTGTNANIAGTISAGAFPAFTSPFTFDQGSRKINSISLRNGSLIGARIILNGLGSFETAQEGFGDFDSSEGIADNATTPDFDIGSIDIRGGGIIGSVIQGPDIGPITVDGFGVLGTSIRSFGNNTVAGITTNGYGIRKTTITGGGTVQQILATGGNGKQIPTTAFSATLRAGSTYDIDPNTGRVPDALTDLNRFFGTTDDNPTRKNQTVRARIADFSAQGNRTLNRIGAFAMSNVKLNFSNSIDNIVSDDVTYALSATTGTLGKLKTGGELANSDISVSGVAKSIQIGGSLKGDSRIIGRGTNGQIAAITTKLALLGQVIAGSSIGTVNVGTDLGSSRFQSITGGVDSLIVGGNVLSGTNVTVATTLGNLTIRGNLQDNSTIRAKKITAQAIGGQIEGDIVIA